METTHERFQGHIIQQKIIQADNPTMVLIKLRLDDESEMVAILARHALTFMLEVQVGDLLSIYGHYNHRKQFIIEKYLLKQKINLDHTDAKGHLHYPKQKRYSKN
ncbi:hypothetical protein ACTQ45_00250 [Fundicoccus sp. Sow4_D5]|uniref:hypothetical protein n=1 Tax=unclassified Fundicoccus TaxID=2761543 RepID=UPI003F8EC764